MRGSRCRAGRADPSKLRAFEPHRRLQGLWFIAGNVVRDFASLNRMEGLPWDVWGMMEIGDESLTDERKALLDRVAALTLAGDEAFPEIRKLYESDERLRMPPVVYNVDRKVAEPLEVSHRRPEHQVKKMEHVIRETGSRAPSN